MREIEASLNPPKEDIGGSDNFSNLSKDPYRSTWIDQFLAMMRRSTYEIIRDPIVTVVKMVTAVVRIRGRKVWAIGIIKMATAVVKIWAEGTQLWLLSRW